MDADQAILNDSLFYLIGGLGAIEATTNVSSFLSRVTEVYDLKTAAYLGIGLTNPCSSDPLVAVTYADEWVSHYRDRDYQRIDPVIQIGLRRLLPVDWNDFEISGRGVRRLFGEAREFGLGRQGLTVPIHAQTGTSALFSVTSDMPKPEWERRRHLHMRDFQVLAAHLHAVVLRVEGRNLPYRLLSPRERECLQWIAAGKTVWECAIILGLSRSTVGCYLESARYKLDATSNTHAVSKAMAAGLLTKHL